ncbi:hypothetical protein ABT185_18385 [Streptomyces clavifer]|uniref:hypothetical protein n=1 Tax=Streptomyces clavifer TaxID=68188 RepID=UPI0033221957
MNSPLADDQVIIENEQASAGGVEGETIWEADTAVVVADLLNRADGLSNQRVRGVSRERLCSVVGGDGA